MTLTRSQSWQKSLPQAILFVTLMAIYLRTLAPGLTWANDGSDGGDLITAVATGGVAHPTGYPLYLLLARLFQSLPLGSLAFRTNLFSAVTTALAAVLVYMVVVNSSTTSREDRHWLAGLAAGYAFGLAPLIWSQAVITEVYGLHGMLVALILILYAQAAPFSISNQKWLDRWRGLALGLAVCNHVSTFLIVPAALVLGSIRQREQQPEFPPVRRTWFSNVRWNRSSFLNQLGTFVAGLSLYLLIPIRAMSDPPINWGNAVTPERFWWLVSGQLYRSYYLEFNLPEILERLQAVASILLHQFGLPGTVLGLVELFLFGKPSRLFLMSTWTAVVCTAFAVVYGSDDSYVYLIPAFLAFAVWIGTGIIGLSNQFAKWSALTKIGLPILLIGYLLVRSAMQMDWLDASTDVRAESFGRAVLSAAPENAILFAQGDRAVFALWYFHFALEERPDLSVVAQDLLHFDWYQENLHATYPSLVVPGPFPWMETIAMANPSRAICLVRYSDAPKPDCSPPGNPGTGK